VRDFRQSHELSRQDRHIDAAVIAHFAKSPPPPCVPGIAGNPPTFRELYDRRGQLVRMLAMEKNQRHSATVAQASTKVLKSIDKHIDYLEGQIKDLEQRMDKLIEVPQPSRPATRILQTITGIGPQVSRTPSSPISLNWVSTTVKPLPLWLAWLPTTTTVATIMASAHIRGGRAKVRVGLYQAAIAAIRTAPT